MVVIADASPLNYLVLIGHAEVLPKLYGRVVTPQAVLQELLHPNTPAAIAAWLVSRPAWLDVEPGPAVDHGVMEDLDPGERQAIALAQVNLRDVLLLIDDERGRQEANRRKIPTTGTLGVLDTAAARGLLDLPVALQKLRATNFHVGEQLLGVLLERDRQRKETGGSKTGR